MDERVFIEFERLCAIAENVIEELSEFTEKYEDNEELVEELKQIAEAHGVEGFLSTRFM